MHTSHYIIIVRVCLALAATAWSLCIAASPEFYVATNGNDQWSGLLPAPDSGHTDGPFASLERARDELRRLKSIAPLTNGATVYVRGGTYYRTDVFELDPPDAGMSNAPIVYRAYTNETPILSGALLITNFLPWKGSILQADVGAQGFTNNYFRQLFFNGHRQQLARFPNYIESDPYKSGWSYVDGTPTNMYAELPNDSRNSFRYKTGDVHAWARPEEAEVVIFPRYNWWNNIIPISSIDASQRIVTLVSNADFAIRPGDRYFVRNVLEELDSPGEWFLDKQSWTLYFWPPCPTPNPVAYAPGVANLVIVTSTNIIFQGFVLECAEETAFGLNGTTNCMVAGCTIRNAGVFGVGVFGQNNGIVGNDIYFVGSDAVYVDGGTQATLTSASNYVENNYVHHIGIFEKGSPAIHLAGVGNRASHNLIHDCPRMGIVLGGNLNVGEYNVIYRVGLESDDTAGIFTSDGNWITSRGNIIRYNKIYDIQGFGFNSGVYGAPYFAWGIFLDSNAAAVDVFGNIVAGCSRGAIMLNNGRDNLVFNNIFLDCAREGITYTGWRSTDSEWRERLPGMRTAYNAVSGQAVWQALRGMDVSPDEAVLPDGLIMASNQIVLNIIAYTNASADLYGFSLVPIYANQWRSNVIHHYGQDVVVSLSFSQQADFAAWQAMGADQNSIIADPLFVNAAGGDYRLQPGSPALAMGFLQIPINEIGLYQSPWRASWPEIGTMGGRMMDLGIAGPDVVVRVQSAVGHGYQLQRADSLSQALWQDIGVQQDGTGDILRFTDAGAAAAPARYYRFQVCP